MNPLFARKTIAQLQAEAQEQEHGLHRTLSAFNLTTLGVGAIIGAGIFTLTGVAAAKYAGPAIVLSFILGGIACTFAGLCYAEMASTVPIAGSAYTYAYATMGELVGWIIGWDLCLEYAVGATTVAVSWSGYVVSFLGKQLGIHIPAIWCNGPPVGIANLPAVAIVLAVTALLVIGVKESANFTSAIVVVKVMVVIAFTVFACAGFVKALLELGALHPPEYVAPSASSAGQGSFGGRGGVLRCFIGFDAVSTTAQEAKNLQRDMPIGILSSLLRVHHPVHPGGAGHHRDRQLHDAQRARPDCGGHRRGRPGLGWLSAIVKMGAILGLTLGDPGDDDGATAHLLLDVARRSPAAGVRLDPQAVSNPTRHDHPDRRAGGHLTAAFLPITVLGELTSIGTLFAFLLVCLGVPILRLRDPDAKRPFRTPWVWVVATAGGRLVSRLDVPAAG